MNIQICLVDWAPRRLGHADGEVHALPDVLRALVQFCHREQGIRVPRTAEVLRAIDRCEPEFHERLTAAAARPIPPPTAIDPAGDERRAAEFRAFADDLLRKGDEERRALVERAEERAAELVGSIDALDALDADPLPDEAFDWSGVPDDIQPKVEEVLALCDEFSSEHFDVEYRTACRRLLARFAADGPEAIRRPGKASSAAAAVCRLIARDNRLLAHRQRGMLSKDLCAAFDLEKAPSVRASGLLRAAGMAPEALRFTCPPSMLIASTRTVLIAARDGRALPADLTYLFLE